VIVSEREFHVNPFPLCALTLWLPGFSAKSLEELRATVPAARPSMFTVAPSALEHERMTCNVPSGWVELHEEKTNARQPMASAAQLRFCMMILLSLGPEVYSPNRTVSSPGLDRPPWAGRA
jgi:hypothetical protein